MRIKNTTGLPIATVREVIRFCTPPGVTGFNAMVRNSEGNYAGRAYYGGSGYHDRACPFVVLRVGSELKRVGKWVGKTITYSKRSRYPLFITPYQYGSQKGKKHWIASRVELLVWLAAHELRHLWQAIGKGPRRGMAYGSRGKFSEVDTEAYALNKLRAWRRRTA